MLADGFSIVDWLTSMRLGPGVALAVCATVAIVGVSWAIAWFKARKSEHRTRLAALMIDRRIPPDEIKRILDAASGPVEESETPAPASSRESEVWLVKRLSDASYSGADADRILTAARVNGEIDPSTAAIISTLAENWADTDDIIRLLEGRRERFTSAQAADPAATRVSPRGATA